MSEATVRAATMGTARFLFVGERPSGRALRLGATWRNGKLSAKVLHDALSAAGYAPLRQRYVNIFVCATGAVSRWSLWHVRQAPHLGLTVVALGGKVRRVLRRAGVPCLEMVHPAARGTIRRRENYRRHVAAVLEVADPQTPW